MSTPPRTSGSFVRAHEYSVRSDLSNSAAAESFRRVTLKSALGKFGLTARETLEAL
jgi:hypothetical protein